MYHMSVYVTMWAHIKAQITVKKLLLLTKQNSIMAQSSLLTVNFSVDQ